MPLLPAQHGLLPVDSGGLGEKGKAAGVLEMPSKQGHLSDVEYQGQGRHDVSGGPPSEWVGATRVSTHREETGDRKQLGKRVSSLSSSPRGPSCAGKRRWECRESGKEEMEHGCSVGSLALFKVVWSQHCGSQPLALGLPSSDGTCSLERRGVLLKEEKQK